jgi:hypothetical protein
MVDTSSNITGKIKGKYTDLGRREEGDTMT